MNPDLETLRSLGWRAHLQQQLDLDELEGTRPARVVAVQRSGLLLFDGATTQHLPLPGRLAQQSAEARPTVGDWVLLDARAERIERLLDRYGLFSRPDPGDPGRLQLLAANVDTAFIVSSCRDDFSLARLERFIAVALAGGAEPVTVLTRADTCAEPDVYRDAAQALRPQMLVETVDARDPAQLDGLRAFCRPGDTVILLGSSGVGKSTLLNSLSGEERALTGSIREDDGKGRHTTTHRELHRLPGGALIIDSPGIRELGMVGLGAQLEATFEDVERLARTCRFADCGHDTEPGCAVQAAIAAGQLEARRLRSWRKLQREDRRATQTVAERRRLGREFRKLVRTRQKEAGR